MVQGFGDMSDEQIASVTGLPPDAARLARQREHSEPFVFSGSAAQLLEIEAAADARGWQLVRGGRFNTITGRNTKATRLEQIAHAYAAMQPAGMQVYTIALGDAPNDAAMIEAADRGFIIANPHGTQVPLTGGRRQWPDNPFHPARPGGLERIRSSGVTRDRHTFGCRNDPWLIFTRLALSPPFIALWATTMRKSSGG
jgi:hypothetical protein